MGKLAQPTPADRLATQQLARDIVRSVEKDEAMQLGLQPALTQATVYRTDVESLAYELASELVRTRRELREACDLAEEANGDPSSCSYIVPVGERIAELRGKGRAR